VFEPPVARIEIDMLAALEVERIICGLLPKYRAAIRAYHIHRYPDHIIRRKLRERDIGSLMRAAWQKIKYELDKSRNIARMGETRADASCRDQPPIGG
jgi:hypothetical protein